MCMLKEVVSELNGVADVALNSELKIAIYKSKLSNKELAERVGITPPNMSNIVNGAIPRLRTGQRIVKELNKQLDDDNKVSIDYLWPLPEEEDE